MNSRESFTELQQHKGLFLLCRSTSCSNEWGATRRLRLLTLSSIYSFIGLALLWQVIFVMIAANPARYRPIMLLSILEKFIYTVPVVILYSLGRVSDSIMWSSLVHPFFGIVHRCIHPNT